MQQDLANANAKIRDQQRFVDEAKSAELKAQRDLKKSQDDWSSYCCQTTLQELEWTRETLNHTRGEKKESESRAIQSENQLDACQKYIVQSATCRRENRFANMQ